MQIKTEQLTHCIPVHSWAAEITHYKFWQLLMLSHVRVLISISNRSSLSVIDFDVLGVKYKADQYNICF